MRFWRPWKRYHGCRSLVRSIEASIVARSERGREAAEAWKRAQRGRLLALVPQAWMTLHPRVDSVHPFRTRCSVWMKLRCGWSSVDSGQITHGHKHYHTSRIIHKITIPTLPKGIPFFAVKGATCHNASGCNVLIDDMETKFKYTHTQYYMDIWYARFRLQAFFTL